MSQQRFTENELAEIAAAVRVIAERAGVVIMELYRRHFEVREKQDRTPVTDADHAAEAVILPALAALTPDIPVISEEDVAAGRAPALAEPTFWAVDPLDGTREFIRRSGEFSVNIGLIMDKCPVLGVLHGPDRGVSYFGYAPGRAFKAMNGGTPAAIAARPLPSDGATVIASRSHGDSRKVAAFLEGKKVANRLAMGSALKFGIIAEGTADLYPRFGPTSEWDTAAGHAILDAAGGRVTTPDGRPLSYGKPDFLNGDFIAVGRTP